MRFSVVVLMGFSPPKKINLALHRSTIQIVVVLSTSFWIPSLSEEDQARKEILATTATIQGKEGKVWDATRVILKWISGTRVGLTAEKPHSHPFSFWRGWCSWGWIFVVSYTPCKGAALRFCTLLRPLAAFTSAFYYRSIERKEASFPSPPTCLFTLLSQPDIFFWPHRRDKTSRMANVAIQKVTWMMLNRDYGEEFFLHKD